MQCVCQVLRIRRSVLVTRQGDSLSRPVTAKASCDHAGMKQREVAEVFNLSSGGAMNKQVTRLREKAKKDRTIA